jgi:hypothetical protein
MYHYVEKLMLIGMMQLFLKIYLSHAIAYHKMIILTK